LRRPRFPRIVRSLSLQAIHEPGDDMARTTPQVTNEWLTGYGAAPIAVGSPAWFAWLEQATRFAFRDPAGAFTARREARGRGAYWRAYRTVDGRQRRAYLGRSADLTPERLRVVAAQLAAAARLTDPVAPARAPAATAAPTLLVLLATKLYVPRPRGALVSRPRLLARLGAGLRGPLTVIAAPAGFGKTTLLTQGLGVGSWELASSPANSQPPTPNSHQVAWLSLDAGDSDSTIFLRYLVAALRTVMPPTVGAMALALLEASPLPPLTTLLTTLINDLASLGPGATGAALDSRRWILVLDDYHAITAPAVHEALAFLLDHLPPTLHLVVASREDPPLPLARLRARGQVAELRAADLRFTAGEAADFLRDVMGLAVSEDDVAALEARTEGWVAGLQLAALALQDRVDQSGFIAAFTGSNRFVVDYLASEVLDRLPPHLRAFVLRTSILERMCGPLCDTLAGVGGWELGVGGSGTTPNSQPPSPNSQLMLEELERANLFMVPLDDQRRWYRYHQLFAGVLRDRLARGEPAEAVAELHRRASTWFERQGLVAEAIRHALAAGDAERAASLIELIAMPLAMEGQQATVAGWLAELPDNLRLARPRLALAYACVAGFNSDYAAAEIHLREAEAGAQAWDEPQAAALRIEAAAFRAVGGSVLGDPRAPELGRMALAHLDAGHPLRSMVAVGISYAAFAAGDLAAADQTLQATLAAQPLQSASSAVHAGLVALLAMVRRAQGRLYETRRLATQVIEATTRDGRTLPLSGTLLAYLLLGLTQCEQNELDAAERTLRQCADLAHQYQVTMYEILAQFYLANVLSARGDLAGALKLVEQAEARASRYLSPLNMRELVGYRVLLWLRQGNLAAAAAWAAQDKLTSDVERPPLTAYDNDRFALAQTLIVQGRWQAARAAVATLLANAEVSGHGRFVIWALVQQALLLSAEGDMAAALASLGRALALAEPEGYVRIFADEGAPMADLLRQAQAQGVTRQYTAKLRAAFVLPGKATRRQGDKEMGERSEELVFVSPDLLVSQSLVEPLSARELEVLRLLADGNDNTQIASALIVAVGTVKSHVNHIFGKLGARNRVDAVRRARELNLL
jgi:LuxR family transcriptional regulator, maltose regulon positive regulatory protein